MIPVIKIEFWIEKTEIDVGDSIKTEGKITPPFVYPIEIVQDKTVIARTFTDPKGEFTVYITFPDVGDFSIYAKIPIIEIKSDTIRIKVKEVPKPPLPPPPPVFPPVPPPPPPTLMLTQATIDQLRSLIRDELKFDRTELLKSFGFWEDYYYTTDVLPPLGVKEFDVIKLIGRIATEGYVINDHDAESLWLSINDRTLVEIKSKEIYPLFKRLPRKLRIVNKTKVPIPYRMEIR